MERTEERISGLVGRTITVTQSEQQRKREKEEINRDSGTYETTTKDLTFMSLKFQEKKKKREGLSKEIISENFLNLANNTNLHI